MGEFFIQTITGQLATRRQLADAGITGEGMDPGLPWFRIQGPSDASTLWYAVLRKTVRGVFIGALAIRHQPHHASLLEQGWEEVPVGEIGIAGGDSDPQMM